MMNRQVYSQSNRSNLNATHEAYLKGHMNKVSRSFTAVVDCLEQPLGAIFTTAYLLCRVADNIEDCTETNEWRQVRFNEFLSLFMDPSLAEETLLDWNAQRWTGLTPDERAMMTLEGGRELWQIYASIPEPYRGIIQHWTSVMVEGMICLNEARCSFSFLEYKNIHVIKTLQDYNQYCFIVAGTVGHMATELAINFYDIGPAASTRLLETGEACGRALQKTNILKDFREDLERGYCYLPDEWLKQIHHLPLSFGGATPGWKAMVYDNVLGELYAAEEYVLTLPKNAAGYRMACLLCLLPALLTNRLAAQESRNLFTENHQYKISRSTMMNCLLDARRIATDNRQIQSYSDRLLMETRSGFLRSM
jgi:farnesyl-diphosphate farnesyltransferase